MKYIYMLSFIMLLTGNIVLCLPYDNYPLCDTNCLEMSTETISRYCNRYCGVSLNNNCCCNHCDDYKK